MLLSLSLAIQHAPLEVREPFAFQLAELPALKTFLDPHIEEALLLLEMLMASRGWRGVANPLTTVPSSGEGS